MISVSCRVKWKGKVGRQKRPDCGGQLGYFATVYFLSVGLGLQYEHWRLLMVQMTNDGGPMSSACVCVCVCVCVCEKREWERENNRKRKKEKERKSETSKVSLWDSWDLKNASDIDRDYSGLGNGTQIPTQACRHTLRQIRYNRKGLNANVLWIETLGS